jgi:hypothetical protein
MGEHLKFQSPAYLLERGGEFRERRKERQGEIKNF